MSTILDNNVQDQLILHLQRGLPLVERPFAEVGRGLDLSEQQVLEFARATLVDGRARRFGAIFDVRRTGYASTLCAAALGADELRSIVPHLIADDGITHCYLRSPNAEPAADPARDDDSKPLPNLWFTYCALRERYQNGIEAVRRVVAPADLLVLPALRRFKIHAVFDPAARERDEAFPAPPGTVEELDGSPAVVPLSESEKQVVRLLQDSIPLVCEPFRSIAEETDYSEDGLLSLLRRWKDSGRLRRIALVVRHRRIGFRGNGMGVWRVPGGKMLEAGRYLAERSKITHCYERAIGWGFPYNLFAMIHTDRPESTSALYRELSERIGLDEGLLFFSVREFKKTSHRLFTED